MQILFLCQNGHVLGTSRIGVVDQNYGTQSDLLIALCYLWWSELCQAHLSPHLCYWLPYKR